VPATRLSRTQIPRQTQAPHTTRRERDLKRENLTARPVTPNRAASRLRTSCAARWRNCGEYTFQALNKIGKLSVEDTGRITLQYLKYSEHGGKGKTRSWTPSSIPLFRGLETARDRRARHGGQKLTKSLIAYSKTKDLATWRSPTRRTPRSSSTTRSRRSRKSAASSARPSSR
jgi:hypothetical protein